VIRDVYERTGVLVDPHTAVGIGAARQVRADADVPMVCLATAHPAKFPDAVEQATGVRPPLPERLADLLDRPERFDVLRVDLAAAEAHVRRCVAG
jgi:threonine synthase